MKNNLKWKKEIERKYVIKSLPQDLESFERKELTQGYTADGTRYRKTESEGKTVYYRTQKKGEGLIKDELEEEISQKEFDAAWPQTEGRRLTKTRYIIPYGEGIGISLDVYHGDLEGHFTAEPEFENLDLEKSFIPPDWFYLSDGSLLDVTDDGRYLNRNLAQFGWPEE